LCPAQAAWTSVYPECWMRAVMSVALLVAGCNQVFGLDETIPGYASCWGDSKVVFDEDNDGRVDGCDTCPGIANPEQLDRDTDGVGDACDPHPDEPRDHIAFFDGFSLPALDTRWHAYGSRGSWEQRDGAVRQTVENGYGTLILAETFHDATVEAVGSGQLPATDTQFTAQGVMTRIDPSDEREFPVLFICFSYFTPASNNRRLVAEDQPLQAIKTDVAMPHSMTTVLRGNTTGDCYGRPDDQAYSMSSLQVAQPIVDGEVGLRIAYTTGAFHAVTVYVTDP
jgi:hypothetical protein